ncbi:MAG: OmpA family protein, partial [Bacteroidia bacterium]|nr:OmpA family protein [Bacteroidia bacterium]
FMHSVSQGTLDIEDIYFPEGSAEYFELCESDLLDVVKLLEEFPAMDISISGHSDQNNEIDKDSLALDRAKSVQAFFEKNNIDSSRIEVAAFGSNHPAIPNASRWEVQENRRVELRIKKHKE